MLLTDMDAGCASPELARAAAGVGAARTAPVYIAYNAWAPSHAYYFGPTVPITVPGHFWDVIAGLGFTDVLTAIGSPPFVPEPADDADGAQLRRHWYALMARSRMDADWLPADAAPGFPRDVVSYVFKPQRSGSEVNVVTQHCTAPCWTGCLRPVWSALVVEQLKR